MLFCSEKYLIFFICIFTTYWLAPWRRARVWLLLAASFYFYASWNQWLAVLITATTVMDYLLARAMDRMQTQSLRRVFLGLSLAVNFGFLVYFKYANFFLDSLQQALRAAGIETSFPVLSVILPIGISFYTFEVVNYIVDVYQRKIPAEKNLGNLMLFILFFPHLVAGPIVRARDFLPQVARVKRFDWARAELGLRFLLLGLFKKIAIADRMAAFADPVFADPSAYSTSAAWIAMIAYWMQIYCDFSGYSDMAVGSAHLLGYKLVQNFRMPYMAVNASELWRRWHISLSTWMRDYVFIPLGGSRKGEWAASRNLLITMTICGLWHGAAWTFVAWGASQGLFLLIHRQFAKTVGKIPVVESALLSLPGTVFRITLTNLTFLLGLAIFRSQSFGDAGRILHQMFVPSAGLSHSIPLAGFWGTLALFVVGHLIASRPSWNVLIERLPPPILGAAQGAACCLALVLAPQASQIFIYFQF